MGSERGTSGGRAFGSVPVQVTVGRSTWATSLFADAKSASYLLPIKAEIRRRAGLGDGDIATLTLEIPGDRGRTD